MIVHYWIESDVAESLRERLPRVLNHEKGWNRAGIVFEESDRDHADVAFRVDFNDPGFPTEPGMAGQGLARCKAFGCQPDTGIDTIVVRVASLLAVHYVLNHELGHVFGLDHTAEGLMSYKQAFPSDDEVEQVCTLLKLKLDANNQTAAEVEES